MGIQHPKVGAGNGFRLDLIGGCSLSAGGKQSFFTNRKAACLMAYLALDPSRRETREKLAGLLWSESGEERARTSLRQALRKVNAALAEAGAGQLRASRESVALPESLVAVDILEALAGLKSHQVDDLLLQEDPTERLLYGLEDVDPAFNAWLLVRRHALQRELREGLETLVCNAAEKLDRRQRAAEALLRLDPSHEGAYRVRIEGLARDGNLAGALRLYKQLWDLLDEEYGMEPSLETQRLIVRLKSEMPDAGPPQAAAAPAAGAGKTTAQRLPRLSVASFLGFALPSRDAYVLEGFRRELLASLVRFREWLVIDGDGMARNSDTVDYALEGAAYGEEDRLYLTITLKEQASQRFIWSERYRLGLNGWHRAQQHLVGRIALALNVYLSADRVARSLQEPPAEGAVYDRWLTGQGLIAAWRPDTEMQAEKIFQDIVAETPDFAPAYASLASIYNSRHIVFPGILHGPGLREKALGYASKSVALDPLDTRGQLALAWSYAMCGRYEQAELHYELSYDLNANDPATLISCAQGLAFCGDERRATELADRAESINPALPAYHWGYLVGVRFLCGDYEASIRAAEIAGDAIYNLPGWRAAGLVQVGRFHEAQAACRHLVKLVEGRWLGDSRPDQKAVFDWFLSSFPIRSPEARGRLAEGLQVAASLAVEPAE